ncbi:hypothetical protein B0A54_18037 [Friedmanniomyces endolithicus]|uniref:Uncharacterized protein n=1 Tax=Friedmanniomyces endolithicus TaxID=329885 RepID=A0A4U0TL59_9PEZI
MSQSNSRTSKRQRDSGLAGSSFTGKTGTTGPYDPQFEQLLIDHGVYPDGYEDSNGDAPEPENIQAIRERLARSRSSLSPSHFDEVAFKQFQRTNRGASSEQNVMMNVFPPIRGNTGTKFYNEGNMLFKNLVQFAPSITDAKPDGYDGARPAEIDLAVRRTLNGYIIPSTSEHLPAAPNNLTEVKGPSGRSDVLRRQAMYAGGVGARGMFELQNYGNETPVYDGNAYTIVPTYHSGEGSLRVYATHPRQSAAGQTEYHMTQLRSISKRSASGIAATAIPEPRVGGLYLLINVLGWPVESRQVFIAQFRKALTAGTMRTITSQCFGDESPQAEKVEIRAASSSEDKLGQLKRIEQQMVDPGEMEKRVNVKRRVSRKPIEHFT